MLDGIKGMAGLAGLMKDLPKLKARMDAVKAQLADVRVEAETGGGAVRAVANGQIRIVDLQIEPALLTALVDLSQPADQTIARELIVGAVNAALTRAQEAAQQRITEAATEAGLPISPDALRGLLG